MTVPMKIAWAKPGLQDLLEYHETDIKLSLNCHHIGTIQSFDPEKQTAVATVNYQKVLYQQVGNLYQPTFVDYPSIDCPVIFLFGGNGGFTVPPKKGDECLILFNDRDIANWYDSGVANQAPQTARLHSFSDGIILVGLKSLPNVIKSFDPARPALRNFDGTAFVAVDDKIEVTNATGNLKSLLQDLVGEVKSLVTAIQGMTVIGVTPGPSPSGPVDPGTLTTLTSIASNLTATSTQIGDLLK